MKQRLGIVALVLAAVVLVWFWFFRTTPPPAPPQIQVSPKPLMTRRLPKKQPTDSNWDRKLRAKARASASAWGKCLAPAKIRDGRAKLTIEWNGSSHLQRVLVSPPVAESIETCLKDQIRGWDLPLAPSLRPFRLVQEVVVGGAPSR